MNKFTKKSLLDCCSVSFVTIIMIKMIIAWHENKVEQSNRTTKLELLKIVP